MALDLYRVSLGLSIEEADGTQAADILSGSGAPGADAAEQDAASIGSIFLRTDASSSISAVYQKIAAGNSVDDWVQSASKDYVDAAVNGLSWREPALVRDGTAYADITAAETAANVGDTVDGVTIVAGSRLLFTNIANYNTIAAQDETDFDGTGANGTFVGGDGAGGTAYSPADTITLSDGTVITVGAVDGNGDVTQFTVTTISTSAFSNGATLTQGSTSGTGTGFTLTPGGANQVQENAAPADPNNIYIVSGSTGAWTFTEDTNAESDGDAVLIQEGTSADQQWVYDGTQWVQFGGASSAAELAFIRAFIGKDSAGAEVPNYSSAVVVTQGNDLEGAIGELDAAIGDRTYTEQNFITDGQTITASLDALDQAIADQGVIRTTQTGVTATTVIDSVSVDEYQAAKWFVVLYDEGDTDQKQAWEVYALNDGTLAADATQVDFNRSSGLRLNGNITGDEVSVVLNGTGAAQTMDLVVTSTDTVTVHATRLDVEI